MAELKCEECRHPNHKDKPCPKCKKSDPCQAAFVDKQLLQVRRSGVRVTGGVFRNYERPKTASGWISVEDVNPKDPAPPLGCLSVNLAEWLEGSISAALGAIDAELEIAKKEGFRITKR